MQCMLWPLSMLLHFLVYAECVVHPRGMWLEHGSDNLAIRFSMGVRMVHDMTVSGYEMGSVFTQVGAVLIRHAPHACAGYTGH